MTGEPSPRRSVFSIPLGVSFVDALAARLLAEAGGDPLELARATVLLPNRRGCRALQEAFLRLSGGRPLLLPRMMPLGDIEADELTLGGGEIGGPGADSLDLPPSIAPLRRQLLLTRAILAAFAGGAAPKPAAGMEDWRNGRPPTVDQAARLAAELARLLDQVQTEQLSFDGLRKLAPDDYAIHWQVTLRFLEILTDAWPKILEEQGCVDPAVRRNLLLAAQAEAWRRNPPTDPVIVAGSTGTVPATAALIEVVAGLPHGRIVLPGLDRDADPECWRQIGEDPSHPQHGLCLLLRRLGLQPADVAPWPGTETPDCAPPMRARVIATALRPAATTDGWRRWAAENDPEMVELALRDVARIDCPGPQEEAGAIALILRAALEVPGKRAALVTPDRALARRVAAELRRWDIAIDDSAGRPLADTPPGTFLRLTADFLVQRVAPVPLLAALKHPLAAGGLEPAAFRTLARRLETAALRGPRPAPGFAGLMAAVPRDQREVLEPWLRNLAAMAEPFAALVGAPQAELGSLLAAHVGFAEALAASATQPGPERLWVGEAGEALADFIADLKQAASGFSRLPGSRYPVLLGSLLSGHVVRPRFNHHPRIAIWGPLEARLQHVDLLILGGLNEGTWPPEAATDPWLSRPMRRAFGLPAPEQRIGRAAHDFIQAFSAPEVVLTRALRVEGTPTVPSRWLMRLDGLLRTLGISSDRLRAGQWLDWQAKLDQPERVVPVAAPEPRPPVSARPRRLSVTQIETWMRDPYAIYARCILRLLPLEPLDADPGAADRGAFLHRALDRFVREHPGPLPPDAFDRLLAIGRQVFGPALSRPSVWAFWWPRFERVAQWFIEQERNRRAEVLTSLTEVKGALTLDGPAGPFELTAKADRIDRCRAGTLAIIDYKTGALPPKRDVELGFSPQLALEAAIALSGGFENLPAAPIGELAYWQLSGGNPAGRIDHLKTDGAADAARAGLGRLIAAFDDEATPYLSQPNPAGAPRYSDYDHLARIKEWSVGGPEGEE